VNPRCSTTAVGDFAGSISPVDEFATPVYNQVRRELFVAEETTQKSSEILEKLDTMIQGLSPLKDLVVRMENIESRRRSGR